MFMYMHVMCSKLLCRQWQTPLVNSEYTLTDNYIDEGELDGMMM